MRFDQYFLLASAGCLAVSAQTLTTMRVSSEIVPAGGMAQVKLLMTSPKPIITGLTSFDCSDVSFDSIDGINLFSPTGDVAGAAVIDGKRFGLSFVSPNGTFGANVDYPIMTMALRLSSSTFAGQVMPVSLDPSASIWQTLSGPAQFEYKQGTITVGGSVNISDVVPGGGVLPAGATFSILGKGFTAKTSIAVRGIATSSVQYVSPTEIRVTAKNGGRLDGVLIQAKNPDNSQDTYYSYMRGIRDGASARALLARTVPILPMNPVVDAIVPSTISPLVNPNYFTALALENAGQFAADVTIQAISGTGDVLGSAVVNLAPRHRIEREYSELFGAVLPTGAYVHVVSSQPVQMMGLLGDDKQGAVTPVWPAVISAPASVAIGK
jgi:hypothetical protein